METAHNNSPHSSNSLTRNVLLLVWTALRPRLQDAVADPGAVRVGHLRVTQLLLEVGGEGDSRTVRNSAVASSDQQISASACTSSGSLSYSERARAGSTLHAASDRCLLSPAVGGGGRGDGAKFTRRWGGRHNRPAQPEMSPRADEH